MSAEVRWDAPSRFGLPGRLARRALERALRPALVRQAIVNAELSQRLEAMQLQLAAGQRSTSGPGDIGDLQYRTDVLERRYELAQARSLLPTVSIPGDGERVTSVAHDWRRGEMRRVLCTNATGTFASLLDVAGVGLEIYARRHRWDLVVSREDLAEGRPAPWAKVQLTRDLLREYSLVAWVDCDAVIVDFDRDLGDELEADKDFYIVEQEGGVPRDQIVNSGVFMARAGAWSERFLAEVWSQEDLTHHRWWENAAIMRLLGYDIEASPVIHSGESPWMDRVKLIDLAWNSIPYWARSPHPRITHYGALAVPRRRLLMLDDVTRTLVRRRRSDPMAHVDSREDLPVLLNRLGLIGVGVEVGVQTGNYSAWIHRWAGARLISIDPWRTDDPDAYVDVANVEQLRHDELFASTQHRLAPFGERSAIWRMTGQEAVAHIGDASLDFVYLDARHDAAAIAEDLEMWAPKVRSGGILAGHDYLDGDRPEGLFGVKTAVDRFLGERGLRVHETVADRPWSSWWSVLA